MHMKKIPNVFSLAVLFFLMTSNAMSYLQPGTQKKIQLNSDDLKLYAEATNFQETGNMAEIKKICHALALKYPSNVKCKVMGFTPENREIFYLITSNKSIMTPEAAKKNKVPVVFIIGGTHSGEIDGKDASILKIKQLLEMNGNDNPLNHLTVVWIPVFNVDGHEHKGRFQRPNQDGPFEQGERTTARRINLNRDWILAQSPEMKAMLRLVNKWDPSVTVDLHVTNGLRFRHDVSITAYPQFGGNSKLTAVAKNLLDQSFYSLERNGHHPIGFYPRLLDKEDPKAGMILDIDTPRISHAYASIRNRIGILVEDHAWNNYATRVKTCLHTLDGLLSSIAKQSNAILNAEYQADLESRSFNSRFLTLDFGINTSGEQTQTKIIDILGYKYDILNPAPIVGGRLISYKLNELETWHIPFHDDVIPIEKSIVKLPESGYIVPVAWAEIVKPYLDLHGLVYKFLKSSISEISVEVFRAQPENLSMDSNSFQGRQMTSISGEWETLKTSIQKGAIFIPINQTKSNLLAHLLEPKGPDSLSSWGLFNTAYEISDYVANHRALELVILMNEDQNKISNIFGQEIADKIPQLKKQYDRKLNDDQIFREDPDARLNFWISSLPQQDSSLNNYPVYRTQTNPFKFLKLMN